jgi:tetratricopeptide (TPR) repeat protein
VDLPIAILKNSLKKELERRDQPFFVFERKALTSPPHVATSEEKVVEEMLVRNGICGEGYGLPDGIIEAPNKEEEKISVSGIEVKMWSDFSWMRHYAIIAHLRTIEKNSEEENSGFENDFNPLLIAYLDKDWARVKKILQTHESDTSLLDNIPFLQVEGICRSLHGLEKRNPRIHFTGMVYLKLPENSSYIQEIINFYNTHPGYIGYGFKRLVSVVVSKHNGTDSSGAQDGGRAVLPPELEKLERELLALVTPEKYGYGEYLRWGIIDSGARIVAPEELFSGGYGSCICAPYMLFRKINALGIDFEAISVMSLTLPWTNEGKSLSYIPHVLPVFYFNEQWYAAGITPYDRIIFGRRGIFAVKKNSIRDFIRSTVYDEYTFSEYQEELAEHVSFSLVHDVRAVSQNDISFGVPLKYFTGNVFLAARFLCSPQEETFNIELKWDNAVFNPKKGFFIEQARREIVVTISENNLPEVKEFMREQHPVSLRKMLTGKLFKSEYLDVKPYMSGDQRRLQSAIEKSAEYLRNAVLHLSLRKMREDNLAAELSRLRAGYLLGSGKTADGGERGVCESDMKADRAEVSLQPVVSGKYVNKDVIIDSCEGYRESEVWQVIKNSLSLIKKNKEWGNIFADKGRTAEFYFVFYKDTDKHNIFLDHRRDGVVYLPVSILDAALKPSNSNRHNILTFAFRHQLNSLNSEDEKDILMQDANFFLRLHRIERERIIQDLEGYDYPALRALSGINSALEDVNISGLFNIVFGEGSDFYIPGPENLQKRLTSLFEIYGSHDIDVTEGILAALCLDLSYIFIHKQKADTNIPLDDLLDVLEAVVLWKDLQPQVNIGTFLRKMEELAAESIWGIRSGRKQRNVFLRGFVIDTFQEFSRIVRKARQKRQRAGAQQYERYLSQIRGILGVVSGVHKFNLVFRDEIDIGSIQELSRVFYFSTGAPKYSAEKEMDGMGNNSRGVHTLYEFKFSAFFKHLYEQTAGFNKHVSVFRLLYDAHRGVLPSLPDSRKLNSVKNFVYHAENDIGGVSYSLERFVNNNGESLHPCEREPLKKRFSWDEDGITARLSLKEFRNCLLFMASEYEEETNRIKETQRSIKGKVKRYIRREFSELIPYYPDGNFDIYISISNPKRGGSESRDELGSEWQMRMSARDGGRHKADDTLKILERIDPEAILEVVERIIRDHRNGSLSAEDAVNGLLGINYALVPHIFRAEADEMFWLAGRLTELRGCIAEVLGSGSLRGIYTPKNNREAARLYAFASRDYRNAGDSRKEIECAEISLELDAASGDSAQTIKSLIFAARIHRELGNFLKSAEYNLRAAELANRRDEAGCEDKEMEFALRCVNIAWRDLFSSDRFSDTIVEKVSLAFVIWEKFGDFWKCAIAAQGIASWYFHAGEYLLAAQYNEKSAGYWLRLNETEKFERQFRFAILNFAEGGMPREALMAQERAAGLLEALVEDSERNMFSGGVAARLRNIRIPGCVNESYDGGETYRFIMDNPEELERFSCADGGIKPGMWEDGERIEDIPFLAREVLSLLDLLAPSCVPGVKLVDEFESGHLRFRRLELPAAEQLPGYPMRGLGLLKKVLINRGMYLDAIDRPGTQFDFAYNEKGYPVGIFPAISEEQEELLAKICEDAMEADITLRWLNLEPFYFDIPAIGSPEENERWEQFVQRLNRDMRALYHYAESTSRFYNLLDTQMNRNLYVRASIDLIGKTHYIKPVLYRVETGYFELGEITADVLSESGRSAAFILPLLPTVYDPYINYEADKVYYSAVLRQLSKGHKVLVVGPGSGLELRIAALLTGVPVYAIGKNPFEVLSSTLIPRLEKGFRIHAILGDNIVSLEGQPRFRTLFDRVLFNAPTTRVYNAHQDRILTMYRCSKDGIGLESIHDGDYGGEGLKRFARGLRNVVSPQGNAVVWNQNVAVHVWTAFYYAGNIFCIQPLYNHDKVRVDLGELIVRCAGDLNNIVREEKQFHVVRIRGIEVEGASDGSVMGNYVLVASPSDLGQEQEACERLKVAVPGDVISAYLCFSVPDYPVLQDMAQIKGPQSTYLEQLISAYFSLTKYPKEAQWQFSAPIVEQDIAPLPSSRRNSLDGGCIFVDRLHLTDGGVKGFARTVPQKRELSNLGQFCCNFPPPKEIKMMDLSIYKGIGAPSGSAGMLLSAVFVHLMDTFPAAGYFEMAGVCIDSRELWKIIRSRLATLRCNSARVEDRKLISGKVMKAGLPGCVKEIKTRLPAVPDEQWREAARQAPAKDISGIQDLISVPGIPAEDIHDGGAVEECARRIDAIIPRGNPEGLSADDFSRFVRESRPESAAEFGKLKDYIAAESALRNETGILAVSLFGLYLESKTGPPESSISAFPVGTAVSFLSSLRISNSHIIYYLLYHFLSAYFQKNRRVSSLIKKFISENKPPELSEDDYYTVLIGETFAFFEELSARKEIFPHIYMPLLQHAYFQTQNRELKEIIVKRWEALHGSMSVSIPGAEGSVAQGGSYAYMDMYVSRISSMLKLYLALKKKHINVVEFGGADGKAAMKLAETLDSRYTVFSVDYTYYYWVVEKNGKWFLFDADTALQQPVHAEANEMGILKEDIRSLQQEHDVEKKGAAVYSTGIQQQWYVLPHGGTAYIFWHIHPEVAVYISKNMNLRMLRGNFLRDRILGIPYGDVSLAYSIGTLSGDTAGGRPYAGDETKMYIAANILGNLHENGVFYSWYAGMSGGVEITYQRKGDVFFRMDLFDRVGSLKDVNRVLEAKIRRTEEGWRCGIERSGNTVQTTLIPEEIIECITCLKYVSHKIDERALKKKIEELLAEIPDLHLKNPVQMVLTAITALPAEYQRFTGRLMAALNKDEIYCRLLECFVIEDKGCTRKLRAEKGDTRKALAELIRDGLLTESPMSVSGKGMSVVRGLFGIVYTAEELDALRERITKGGYLVTDLGGNTVARLLRTAALQNAGDGRIKEAFTIIGILKRDSSFSGIPEAIIGALNEKAFADALKDIDSSTEGRIKDNFALLAEKANRQKGDGGRKKTALPIALRELSELMSKELGWDKYGYGEYIKYGVIERIVDVFSPPEVLSCGYGDCCLMPHFLIEGMKKLHITVDHFRVLSLLLPYGKGRVLIPHTMAGFGFKGRNYLAGFSPYDAMILGKRGIVRCSAEPEELAAVNLNKKRSLSEYYADFICKEISCGECGNSPNGEIAFRQTGEINDLSGVTTVCVGDLDLGLPMRYFYKKNILERVRILRVETGGDTYFAVRMQMDQMKYNAAEGRLEQTDGIDILFACPWDDLPRLKQFVSSQRVPGGLYRILSDETLRPGYLLMEPLMEEISGSGVVLDAAGRNGESLYYMILNLLCPGESGEDKLNKLRDQRNNFLNRAYRGDHSISLSDGGRSARENSGFEDSGLRVTRILLKEGREYVICGCKWGTVEFYFEANAGTMMDLSIYKGIGASSGSAGMFLSAVFVHLMDTFLLSVILRWQDFVSTAENYGRLSAAAPRDTQM